jgi:hypothetical protein
MSTYTVKPNTTNTRRKPVGGKGVRASLVARALADHERAAQALADALGQQRRILRSLGQ